MKLSPLDIKKQEFKKSLRGYDTVEVDAFMEMMSAEFTELTRQVKELKEQVMEYEIQLRDFKQKERDLQQVLMQAQETSTKSIENSKKEGQLIIQEAELKASQVLELARMDVMRVKEEVTTLKSKKDSIISRLKVLLNSELELIKSLEMEEDEQRDTTQGTGKEHFNVDEVLKKL